MNFHHLKRLAILLSVFSFAPNVGCAASYAPLDCAKTSTAAETAIRKSYALGQDEAHLATLFGVLTSRCHGTEVRSRRYAATMDFAS